MNFDALTAAVALARTGRHQTVDALKFALVDCGIPGAKVDAGLDLWRDYLRNTGGPDRSGLSDLWGGTRSLPSQEHPSP